MRSDGQDMVLCKFLDFLLQDMARYPLRLQAVDRSLLHRLSALVEGVEVDLDAPLSDSDE